MLTISKTLTAFVLPLAFIAGLAACDRQGTAEKAGEKIDEVFEKDGDATDGPMENAGEEIDEEVEDMKDAGH